MSLYRVNAKPHDWREEPERTLLDEVSEEQVRLTRLRLTAPDRLVVNHAGATRLAGELASMARRAFSKRAHSVRAGVLVVMLPAGPAEVVIDHSQAQEWALR